MPQVPSYGGQQVSPTSNAGTAFAAPTEQNAAPQQLQQAGDALQKNGGAAGSIALDMQQQANQVRVDDALNKVRRQALDLTYDPQAGYKTLKGDAALTRPDGQHLVDEYGGKLQQSISDISGELGNDYQRRAFSMQANDLLTQFQSGVMQHTVREYKDYALSTQDGTIKLGVDQAKLNWNNPDQIRQALNSVQAAVYKMGDLKGDSANEIQANLKATTSAVHQGVIAAALQSNNPTYAQQYLSQYKDQMTADDILKTTGLVNHDLDSRQAITAVQGATSKLSPQIQPTDLDRLTNIVMGMESNGNRDAVGRYIPGQGTAKGSMQVMDATNGNPGYGVTPAKDGSPEERARVGRDYLAAMVKQYGNPAQAMAAYNAGPGRLDKAISTATASGEPQNWLAYMPPETQAYVQKGVTKLGAGAGQPAFPTESQFVQTAIDSLGPNPRIEQVKMTREQAAVQYTMLDKSRKEQGEQVVQRAQQALIQNGGSFAALDPQTKADVLRFAPDKYDDLQGYAGKIADPVRADNLAAYNQAVSHPDELAGMPDSEFDTFVKQNFTQRTAREIVKLRDNQINGKIDTSAEAINSKSVTTTLNNRLLSIGINPTPKPSDLAAKERLGTVQKYVRDTIYNLQAQTGKKMTPAEIESQITGMFAKDVTFQNTLFGFNNGTSTQKMLSMTPSDIPQDSAVKLRQLFAQAGNVKPTDDQMMRAYWKWKNAK